MKKFKLLMKQLLPRIIIALIIIGVLFFFLVWQPYSKARGVVLSEIQRREENRNQRQTLTTLLVSMRSPGKVPSQELGSFKAYSNEAQRVVDNISNIELIPPPKLRAVPYTPIPAVKSLVENVNAIITDPQFGQRYQQSRVALITANELLSYHAAVMKALVNLLEYNPAQDFKTFDISSSDTKERLNLAQSGLEKAVNRINKAKVSYNDPYLNEIIVAIERLKQGRDILEREGDVSRWTQAVKSEQAKIIANRTIFWKTESDRLIALLNNVESELLAILKRWKEIKSTFESY